MDGFERNVFINCPFDDGYLPIIRPIIFCVLYLGFRPRIALERLDSGEARISKIIELIRSSKYGIHDLSRLKSDRKNEFFRLNMPFELGLDVGCRIFRRGRWAEKRCLILEAERYRFQAAISDLSNSDIGVHGNEPSRALAEVRNWLVMAAQLERPRGAAAIWDAFTEFTAADYADLIARGYSLEDVRTRPIGELIPAMSSWMHAATGRG